jgi:glycosyltransferase involved in cell wall biosynthesis
VKKIAIDASVLYNFQGGISHYVFYLLHELIQKRPQDHFYLYSPSSGGDLHAFEKYENVSIRVVPFLSIKNILWRNLTLPFLMRKDQIDIYWQTLLHAPLFISKKTKILLTVYDFVPQLYPETLSPLQKIYGKLVTKSSLHRAESRMVISRATGKKLQEMFGLDYQEVVYPPHKPEITYKRREFLIPFLEKLDLKYNDYLVTVGTWEPRKNFALLTRLYLETLEFHGAEKVMPLVVIGGGGWKNQEIRHSFFEAQKKYPSHFKIAGFVSDRTLAFYLSGAKYYVALSVYEGYGMPIAEARRCRTPVVSMDTPEMREAAEEDALFLKPEEIAAKLSSLMLRSEKANEEKSPLILNYPVNHESAEKISQLIG